MLGSTFARMRISIVFLLVLPTQLLAQQSVPGLPPSLAGLTADQFASAAKQLVAAGDLTDAQRVAIRQQAASYLATFNFVQADSSLYPSLDALYELGQGALGDIEQRIVQALGQRQDNWADRPYDEIRGKIGMMIRAGMPFKAYFEAKQWIAAGGTLDKISQSEQGVEDMKNPYAPVVMKVLFNGDQVVLGDFSVSWDGWVTAPTTGSYTFSISPINVSATHDNYQVSQTITVAVNGQQVIAAKPDNWVAESAPINLTAGQPVRLQAAAAFVARGYPAGALHATLFWQGPGVAKAIVPATALDTPDNSKQGLLGTYRWTDQGQPKQVSQVDPTIDFDWAAGGLLVGGDAAKDAQANALAGLLWQQFTGSQYLDGLEDAGQLHPFLMSPEVASFNISSAQRRSFLQTLVNRPALLEPATGLQMVTFYRAFRMGAWDQALNAFGAWASQLASRPSEMPSSAQVQGVDLDFRDACRQMAICVTQELPPHRVRLQNEFLQLPDGTCSLPVAYVLGYSYESLGELDQWQALLDARLTDPSLSGDARVNWLIARAHAQEISGGQARPYVVIKERVLDGRGWLEEAQLTAEDPAVKARVAGELAACVAAALQFDNARQILQQAASSAPVEQKAILAAWQQDISKFEAEHGALQSQRGQSAKAGRLQSLRERRDRALERGDQQAAARYDALIDQASASE